MLVIVPCVAGFLIFVAVSATRPSGTDWRDNFLLSTLLWGLALTLITEVTSIFSVFIAPIICIFWVALGLTALLWATLHKKNLRSLNLNFRGLDYAGLALVGAILVLVGLNALVAPPNNFDSMVYHMPRVAHWIQDHSVNFFATSILRQLYQPPWAEYAIANFHVLSAGDYYDNLVQWFSMLGCSIGVSFLAAQLSSGKNVQLLASILCVTLPMGIAQATGTQNNYVLAFWLVCLGYFALRLQQQSDPLSAFGMGTGLGLAVLTKGTAYALALPFIAWAGISASRRALSQPRERAWKPILLLIVAMLLALTINLGHYARNFALTGSPLGSASDDAYANEIFTPAVFTSGVIRNIALHLGTPSEAVNAELQNVVLSFTNLSELHRTTRALPTVVQSSVSQYQTSMRIMLATPYIWR